MMVNCAMHDGDDVSRRMHHGVRHVLGPAGLDRALNAARSIGTVAGVRLETIFAPEFRARMTDRILISVLIACLTAPIVLNA